MRKIIIMAAIAAVLTTAHLAFADPPPTSAPDHVHAATSGTEQPAPQAPAWSPSSDAPAPAANAGLGENSFPVGFGWG
jgi:hypothetical protein